MRGLVAVVVVFAAFVPPALAGGRSGIYGVVERGPVTPVCKVGTPCSKPATHVRLVFSRSGSRVSSTETNRSGGYRVALRPGRYIVRLAISQRIGGLRPTSVVVPNGRYVRLDLNIDTGIR
jgi:hypothetical protein